MSDTDERTEDGPVRDQTCSARSRRRAFGVAVIALLVGDLLPVGDVHAAAQPGITLTGLEVVLGLAVPDGAETAFAYGARLGLGGPSPRVRVGAGLSAWTADIDRDRLDDPDASATISDLAFDVDARVMPLRIKMVRPYVLGAVALHFVSADIPGQEPLDEALSGTHAGIDIGVGMESVRSGIGWRAEARRRLVNDVDGWMLTAGVRYVFGK